VQQHVVDVFLLHDFYKRIAAVQVPDCYEKYFFLFKRDVIMFALIEPLSVSKGFSADDRTFPWREFVKSGIIITHVSPILTYIYNATLLFIPAKTRTDVCVLFNFIVPKHTITEFILAIIRVQTFLFFMITLTFVFATDICVSVKSYLQK